MLICKVSSYLVLLRLELAITSLLSQSLGLSRNRSEPFASYIFDNRRDETIRRGDRDRDVRLLVPETLVKMLYNVTTLDTYCLIVSPSHAEFASGTSVHACDTAFRMKSFTLNFAPLSFSASCLLKTSRSLLTLLMSIDTVR